MTCAVFALAIRVADAKSWRHRAQPARVSGERQSSRGLLLLTAEPAQQPHDGIEELVGHPLLERDDRVVRDVDVLGADLGTTLRSEEHTSELQSRPHLVCRLLLEKKTTTRRQQ